MATKKIYITVELKVLDTFDEQDVVSEMDYNMIHEGIVGTEIVDVEKQKDRYGWED